MLLTKISTIVLLLFFLWTATNCSKETDKSIPTIFASAQYKGNYLGTIALLSPDSAVKRIKEDVLSKWAGYACEGVYYRFVEGTPDSVLLRYLDLCEQNFPHDSILIVTQGLRSRILIQQSRLDTALVCLKISESLAHKLHSTHRIADSKYYLGKFYSRQYNYPEAIKMLHEAFDLFATFPESLFNGQQLETLLSLANAYRGANDFASAQIWDLYAWHLAQRHELKDYKIMASAAVAYNYLNTQQLDSAKMLIDSTFHFHDVYKDDRSKALHYRVLGQIQVAQGDCTAALPNLLKGQQGNLQQTDLVNTLLFDEALADGYLCLGRLDSAIYWYQKALTTPDPIRQAAVHAQLGKAYFQTGNQALAYKHETENKKLSERIFTKEKDKALGRLQAKSELDMREREVVMEENRAKMTRFYMVGGLFALSVFSGIGLVWGMRKRQEGQLAQQEKAKIQQEKEHIETRVSHQKQALEQTQQVLVVRETALEEVLQKLIIKESALEKTTEQLGLKDLFIEELALKLTLQDWQTHPSVSGQIEKEKLHNLKILTKDDWLKFRKLFSQHSPHFMTTLQRRFPKLTESEIRLVLLVKLQLDANETAGVLGIEPASVYKSRYRLRQKLDLKEDVDLDAFIQQL